MPFRLLRLGRRGTGILPKIQNVRIVCFHFDVHDCPEAVRCQPIERHSHHLADLARGAVSADEVLSPDDLISPRLRICHSSGHGMR